MANTNAKIKKYVKRQRKYGVINDKKHKEKISVKSTKHEESNKKYEDRSSIEQDKKVSQSGFRQEELQKNNAKVKVECSFLGEDLVDKILKRYEEFGYNFGAQSSTLLEPFFKNGKTSETQFTYEDKKRIVNFYDIHFVSKNIKDSKKIEFYMPYFGQHATYEQIFTPIEFMRYSFENLFCCKESKNVDAQELNLEKSRNSENNIKTSL